MGTKIIVENKKQFEEAEQILNGLDKNYRETIEKIEQSFSCFTITLHRQFGERINFLIPSNCYDILVTENGVSCSGSRFRIILPKNEKQEVEIKIGKFELKIN